MTMASSTTKPVAMVRAIRVRLFRLKPKRYMTPKVPTRETGTATLGMMVAGEVAQEQEDDHDHQDHGQHQLELHVFDGAADGGGAVGQHGDVHRRRQGALQLGQQLLDAVDDLDDVGAGLALDVDDHRRGVVHPGRLLDVFGARRWRRPRRRASPARR